MTIDTTETSRPTGDAGSAPEGDQAGETAVTRSGWHDDWRVLLAAFTLAGVVESQAFGHFSAFTPLFLQELHVPGGQVATWTGILSALSFVIGIPLLPFWGIWADRYGRKLIIVRSAYVEGIVFTLAAFSPNVWALAVARFLSGFVFGNTGVMLALLADRAPRKRLGLAVGIASAGFPLGASIGPYLGGLIAQGPGIRTLLFVDGCLSAAMGLMLTLVIREKRRARSSSESSRALLRAAVGDITASPTVTRLFLLYFIAMYGISQVTPFIPILLQRLYAGPKASLPTVIGTTLTASGIAMAVTTPLWGRLGDLIGRWRVLPICLGAVAIGIATGGLVASLLPLQAAIVWVGLFQGGIGTTVIALLALLAPEERRASILNFSLLPSQLSWFVGPITGAALAGVGLQLPFATGALALCVAMVLALYNARGADTAERA
ncbi:MAG TPA: MFS transporter [Ktedonobacterales bacterium]